MKRNIIITLLISVLTAAGLFFAALHILRGNGAGDYDLRIPESTVVTRIVLESSGQRVVLEEKKDTWLINGREEVRKTAIDLILAELEGMQPVSPVSESIIRGLEMKRSGSDVSVRVFSKGRKIRSFIVTHYKDHDYPGIIRKKAGQKALIYNLPGYDIDACSVFIADIRYWRPFTIFKIMPSEIREVSVEYPADNSKSFTIVNNSGKVGLKESASFDTLSVKRYLSYFVNVPFESINTSLTTEEEKSIISSTPFVKITVTTKDSNTRQLKGWKRYLGEGEKSGSDTDRLWGKLDNGNLFVMRYFDVDPLLKKRSYFQQVK